MSSATEDGTGAAEFDVSPLSDLCIDRPERLRHYIEVMIESLSEAIGEAVRAADRRDIAAVRAMGHRIKSTASSGGAMRLAEIGRKLELETSDANLDQQCALAATLPVGLERLKEVITKMT